MPAQTERHDGQVDGSKPSIRFSVVTPAYNEEDLLPRLLDTVDAARNRYAGGAAAIEMIVADNVSTDATAEVARRRGCEVVRVEKRVIGAVRNGGAKAARGEILLFADADIQLHPETFNAIDRALAARKVSVGATGIRMERMSLPLAMVTSLGYAASWLFRVDIGPIFCRKEDFDAVGGYDEELLFKEDLRIIQDLKRHGKRQGKKFVRCRSAKAIFSTRKMDEHGHWDLLKIGVYLIALRLLPAQKQETRRRKFALNYWYGRQRKK